jgi:hypothetical protein
MLYVATYCDASAVALLTAWFTSEGTRLEKVSASAVSAHSRRDHFSPSVSRCSSVVMGKFSRTMKAILLAKKSSVRCALGA